MLRRTDYVCHDNEGRGARARYAEDIALVSTTRTSVVPTPDGPTVGSHVGQPPAWSRWREAGAVVLHPPHLRRTIRIALLVGTILFAINQLDIVIRGQATPSLWLKCALTYLVPFCTSNFGVLVATRQPDPHSHRRSR